MSTSTPRVWRTLLLWLHIVSSVSWLSQAVTLLVLVVLSAASTAGDLKVAAADMAYVLDATVLVASAITAASTGLGLAAVTSWGYFHHWWISTKVVLTTAQILVGTAVVAGALTEISTAARTGRDGPVLLAGVALVLISAALGLQVWLSIAKPWGRTARGRRARHQLPVAPDGVVAAMFVAPLIDIALLAGLGFPLPVFALLTLGVALRLRHHRLAATAEPATDTTPTHVTPGTVVRRSEITAEIVTLRIAPIDGSATRQWEPGAHIDLHLASGRIRQYSLCGDPSDRSGYDIAVLREADGRGGSTEIHDLEAGAPVGIGSLRNNFPLVEASDYLFVAGGIGITPLMPMIEQADSAGASWRLVYRGSSLLAMAFAEQLAARHPERVQLLPADTTPRPDLAATLRGLPPGAAVYCCGPTTLMDALAAEMPTACPAGSLHLERFTATDRDDSHNRAFRVVLARPGTIIDVPADRSLLDCLREAQVDTPASCETGLCGNCQLTVLDGHPEHRDQILHGDDRERTDLVYPCVSRARYDLLVLDT